MKRNKIIVSTFCTTVFLIASCGGSSEDNEIQNVNLDLTDSTVTSPTTDIAESSTVEYAVPTPNELFEIIKLQGGEKQIDLVNSLENSENYIDQKSKSLNFGVYSADIAYLSCFGIGTDFLRYFKKIEELGESLGIAGAFDEDIIDRIEENESDSDSLFAISNDSYYDSYAYLEENEKGTELALIMAGGFIESLYIIANLVDTYSAENPIVQKIGDQKVVLENLIAFISQYNESEAVQQITTDLADLEDVFEKNMILNESETSVINEGEGRISLEGGNSYEMTEAAYNAIKEKALELRKNIIN